MKQLTCEMCGSTDLIKQDGVFVCQACGCKYSIEEAKKMMVEVSGAVEVKNAAQLENLLKLANSSFASKNYAQAEEFCNQVIAMDDKNYEAWKLKGEAINYQISSSNPRILEVYNCIMTSYHVLPDDEKEVKKYEIISSLKTCFEGEVDFWLKQFEVGRPTSAALTRAKNAYIDAYNKMKAAFETLELEESKEGYLTNFDNFFIGKCNAICNDAWKTTVGYNYYRDYMGRGKDPFGRTDQRWIIADTDLYRPSKHIWDTFREEADNLINLLQFAEEHFNEDTNPKVMEAIYSNIAFFEECIIPSGSWKITQGYTSNWDTYKTVGWHEEYNLSPEAKSSRMSIVSKYRNKASNVPAQVEARQQAKKERERQEKIAQYWNEHSDEKAQLDSKRATLQADVAKLNSQHNIITEKINQIAAEHKKETPASQERAAVYAHIGELRKQRETLGFFKGKQARAIDDEIASEETKLRDLEKMVSSQEKSQNEACEAELKPYKEESARLQSEIKRIQSEISEIDAELNKDR